MKASVTRSSSARPNAAQSSAGVLLAVALLASAPASAQAPAPVTDPAPSTPPLAAPRRPLAPEPAPSPSAPARVEAADPEGKTPAPASESAPAQAPDGVAPASQPATPAAAPAPVAPQPAPSVAEPAPSIPKPARPVRAAQPAPDPTIDNPLVVDPQPRSPAPDTPRLDAWLGVHGLIVSSPGFDAFSEDDALTSFGAGVGVELGAVGGGRLAAVAGISLGGDEEGYRSQDAELSVVRLTLGPELRFPFGGRFFAYGRLSPELLHFTAELADDSSATSLEQGQWLFGVDTALGVAVRLADVRPQGMTAPLSIFARLEAGYVWSPETELSLSPRGSNGPIRSEPLALGDLSLSGVSFRGALGVGY